MKVQLDFRQREVNFSFPPTFRLLSSFLSKIFIEGSILLRLKKVSFVYSVSPEGVIFLYTNFPFQYDILLSKHFGLLSHSRKFSSSTRPKVTFPSSKNISPLELRIRHSTRTTHTWWWWGGGGGRCIFLVNTHLSHQISNKNEKQNDS